MERVVFLALPAIPAPDVVGRWSAYVDAARESRTRAICIIVVDNIVTSTNQRRGVQTSASASLVSSVEGLMWDVVEGRGWGVWCWEWGEGGEGVGRGVGVWDLGVGEWIACMGWRKRRDCVVESHAPRQQRKIVYQTQTQIKSCICNRAKSQLSPRSTSTFPPSTSTHPPTHPPHPTPHP